MSVITSEVVEMMLEKQAKALGQAQLKTYLRIYLEGNGEPLEIFNRVAIHPCLGFLEDRGVGPSVGDVLGVVSRGRITTGQPQ